MDAMGHLVDDLIARTHELLQPNPGQLISHSLIIYLFVSPATVLLLVKCSTRYILWPIKQLQPFSNNDNDKIHLMQDLYCSI